MKEKKVSCIVHACNSASSLGDALKSVKWADELIVIDMESTDDTVAVAGQFTDTIYTTRKVPMVDSVRNMYLDKASGPWILVLDSDEYLPEDAQEQIMSIISKDGGRFDAFAIPRYNYIAGQIMQGSGWYPDHQIRLFRKGTVKWKDANHLPPEVISGPHKLMRLAPPGCLHIHHDNYRDLSHFIEKQVSYALNDRYPSDPEGFDFNTYIAQAFERLASRRDVYRDGDVSKALAIIMAWDSMVRGVIHWGRLSPRPALGDGFALPIVTTSHPYSNSGHSGNVSLATEERLHRLDAIENSLAWLIVQRINRFIDNTLFPWNTRRGRFYLKTVRFLMDRFIVNVKKKSACRMSLRP